MILREKLGSLNEFDAGNRMLDLLPLEWYETAKRILHKKTASGTEIILKFLKQNPGHAQDDVVYQDDARLIVIDIQPCETIVIRPANMYEAACICYEIGNKHLPLFYEGGELLVPFEPPLFRLLEASGYQPRKEVRKLLHPVKTTVSPHRHSSEGSLFSKILQLTSSHDAP